MGLSGITDAEARFTGQRDLFLAAARIRYASAPTTIDDLLSRPPAPLPPVVVGDLTAVSDGELDQIAQSYANGYGVVYVVPRAFAPRIPGELHPLRRFADQLSMVLPLCYPVDHPMEGHPEARARFGTPDGTLKLYDLPVPPAQDKYREQAETNQLFAAHNDGLGYAGLIRSSILVLDRPPMCGGYTYFQNLVRLAPALAATDPDAFQALFLPDAITALRPRGKGAIRVSSPVFFLNRDGDPQVFFRVTTGEYLITWRDQPALQRARALHDRVCAPFGPDSRFVHFMRPGESVVIDNRQVAHGRTDFLDPPGRTGRVLARKWFVPTPADAVYRHVPGIEVQREWAAIFPERFSGDAIMGEWHYDPQREENVRIG